MTDQIGIVEEVLTELSRARAKFPAFNSAHEGYAVLLEEVEELKAEVFWGKTSRNERMRSEAIQVAAMALRFIEDVALTNEAGISPAVASPEPATCAFVMDGALCGLPLRHLDGMTGENGWVHRDTSTIITHGGLHPNYAPTPPPPERADRRLEAAWVEAERRFPRDSAYINAVETRQQDFLAGVQWARAESAAELAALREALVFADKMAKTLDRFIATAANGGPEAEYSPVTGGVAQLVEEFRRLAALARLKGGEA